MVPRVGPRETLSCPILSSGLSFGSGSVPSAVVRRRFVGSVLVEPTTGSLPVRPWFHALVPEELCTRCVQRGLRLARGLCTLVGGKVPPALAGTTVVPASDGETVLPEAPHGILTYLSMSLRLAVGAAPGWAAGLRRRPACAQLRGPQRAPAPRRGGPVQSAAPGPARRMHAHARFASTPCAPVGPLNGPG